MTGRPAAVDDGTVELDDGRTLQYATYGPTDGRPVVFCHGTPGSRVCVPDPDAVVENDARFVGIDRPGYGGSDPNPGWTPRDWAADVRRVVDELDVDRFAVAGVSGGAPHALACAAVLPDRVTNVAVVSGMAPLDAAGDTAGMSVFNRVGLLAAKYVPSLLPLALRSMAKGARADPDALVADAISRYAPPDQRVAQHPDVRATMVAEVEAAYRQGTTGHVADLTALARAWGFDPAELSVPVRLWHGGADRNAPLSMAQRLADLIPDAHLTIFPDEGHLVVYEHFDRILAALVGQGR